MELTVVISIAVILFAAAVPVVVDSFQLQDVKRAATNFKNALEKARVRAIASRKPVALVILQNELAETTGEGKGLNYAYRGVRICEVEKINARSYKFIKWLGGWIKISENALLHAVKKENSLIDSSSFEYKIDSSIEGVNLTDVFKIPSSANTKVSIDSTTDSFPSIKEIGIEAAYLKYIQFDYSTGALGEKAFEDFSLDSSIPKAYAYYCDNNLTSKPYKKDSGSTGGLVGLVFDKTGLPEIDENLTFFFCKGVFSGDSTTASTADFFLNLTVAEDSDAFGEIISLNKFTGLAVYEEVVVP